mmetsp:Transcript_13289/g.36617  ORF Transcript_13289/g.36617 Transcript_13289/m.36617 type:complete len:202 (-) Transcript_13289:599-1204(-)
MLSCSGRPALDHNLEDRPMKRLHRLFGVLRIRKHRDRLLPLVGELQARRELPKDLEFRCYLGCKSLVALGAPLLRKVADDDPSQAALRLGVLRAIFAHVPLLLAKEAKHLVHWLALVWVRVEATRVGACLPKLASALCRVLVYNTPCRVDIETVHPLAPPPKCANCTPGVILDVTAIRVAGIASNALACPAETAMLPADAL